MGGLKSCEALRQIAFTWTVPACIRRSQLSITSPACKFSQTCPMIERVVCQPRGRGGMADAADLRKNLSARRKTGEAELLKVGETFQNGNPEPSPARRRPGRCRD